MYAEKRKRSANFSDEEKMRFLRILQNKGQVIVSKVTAHDLTTNRAKEEAWAEITSDLNASGNIMRTPENLKKLWQKMKQEAKSFHQTPGTGGEPSKKMDDPILELVLEITGNWSSGIEMVQDETTVKDEISKEEQVIPKTQENFKRRRPNLDCNDNERSCCKATCVSLNNTFARERLKSERDKKGLIELQKQHMIEEHDLKIKQLKLKNEILETILNNIQDEKPVFSELLKIF